MGLYPCHRQGGNQVHKSEKSSETIGSNNFGIIPGHVVPSNRLIRRLFSASDRLHGVLDGDGIFKPLLACGLTRRYGCDPISTTKASGTTVLDPEIINT